MSIPSSLLNLQLTKLPEKDLSLLWASEVFEIIQKEINNARKKLKKDEEIIAEIPMKDGTRITVESFGYHNPTLIFVWGNDGKNKVQLLIHAFELQIILSIGKKAKNTPIRPIGFHQEGLVEETKHNPT